MILTLAAAFSAAACTVGVLALRVHTFSRSRPPPVSAPAIVVLGARVLPNGKAAPALELRVEKAAALYRQGVAPLVIFSGGASAGLPTEASVAREIALRLGVPLAACVLEENSHSTFENAQLTAPLLHQRQISDVVLVTDDYHLLRATLQFSAVGIRTQAVASDRSMSSNDHAYWTVREAIALLRRPSLLFGSPL